MEQLSVSEVSDLLRSHGFPETLIQNFNDNYIDGAALLALRDDFTEFKQVVPQSGLRLKLKGLIGNGPSIIHESSNTNLQGSAGPISESLTLVKYDYGTIDTELVVTSEDDNVSEPVLVISPSSNDHAQLPVNITNSPCSDTAGDLQQVTSCGLMTPSPPSKKSRREILEEDKENCQANYALTPTLLKDSRRLPNPCPLPTNYSKRVQDSLRKRVLSGNDKLMFLHEAFTFYYGICPNPLPNEYDRICETLCSKFPELKDKLPANERKPWDTIKRQMSQKFRNLRRCSEPTSSRIKEEGKYKIVTLANAIPASTVSPKPSCDMPTSTGEDDEVAYRRNTSKLIKLFCI